MKHSFRKVWEGVVYRLSHDGMRKAVAGAALMAVIPLQLLAPVVPGSLQTSAWQTELVMADATPELLVAPQSMPAIEKVASRYDEEQAKLAAEREKARLAAAKKAQAALASAPRTNVVQDVPYEQKVALAQKAAATYNIPTQLLIAVWKKESGMRWYFTGGSSVGARGPAQFMPGTWKAYAVDGNGDGVKDIFAAEDAIFAAARYLAANGANRGDYRNALFRYNHAEWYVNSVLQMAGMI